MQARREIKIATIDTCHVVMRDANPGATAKGAAGGGLSDVQRHIEGSGSSGSDDALARMCLLYWGMQYCDK